MLSLKQLNEIRTLLTAIIKNVSEVSIDSDTLHLLGVGLLATFNRIKLEHGDSDCHACKVLFTKLLKEAPKNTQEIFESLR